MEDRTFYCLSYLAFCLAMFVPFGWVILRARRQAKVLEAKDRDNPNQSG